MNGGYRGGGEGGGGNRNCNNRDNKRYRYDGGYPIAAAREAVAIGGVSLTSYSTTTTTIGGCHRSSNDRFLHHNYHHSNGFYHSGDGDVWRGATAVASSRDVVSMRAATTLTTVGVSSDVIDPTSLFDTLDSVFRREQDGYHSQHNGRYRCRVWIGVGSRRYDGGDFHYGHRGDHR